MKLAPSSIATRSIIRLPDLPDQEKVNWHKELPRECLMPFIIN